MLVNPKGCFEVRRKGRGDFGAVCVGRLAEVRAEGELLSGVGAGLEEVVPNGPVLWLIEEVDENGEWNSDAGVEDLGRHLSGFLEHVVVESVVGDAWFSALGNVISGREVLSIGEGR